MSGPVWSDLQEARRHSVLPVNRTMLGCLGLFHSNVFRQVQVQFLPASVRALNRACYVKKAKQIALNRSFKCDHRALFIHFVDKRHCQCVKMLQNLSQCKIPSIEIFIHSRKTNLIQNIQFYY